MRIRNGRAGGWLLALVLGCWMVGNGSAPGQTPGPPPSAPLGASKPADSPEKRLAALRKKTLRDEDFVESEQNNRDPFRSYLGLFVDKGTERDRRVAALFDKFALEELSLIAVVSGDANPRAMFRDPSGMGQTVRKGDYISRVAARVTKILSDRVIVELTETTGTGEPRVLEKAILVNPEETP
jgi:Tfp pilus assembly protein PilP